LVETGEELNFFNLIIQFHDTLGMTYYLITLSNFVGNCNWWPWKICRN